MTDNKTYLFEFSYGRRTQEIGFISDILANFDNDILTGVTILANNNIYNLEFLLLLSFEKDSKKFDDWLFRMYPSKKANFMFNYSPEEIITN